MLRWTCEMDLIVDAAFPQTSWGKYLDYLAEELAGLDRQAATNVVVVLVITGAAGATVPAESLVSAESGVNFTTDADAVVSKNGAVSVKATAQSAWAGGNVSAGTVTVIPVSIYGVSAVTNETDACNGYEEDEPSEDLIQKVRDRIAEECPVGADVTVVAPAIMPVDIALTVTKGTG